MNQNTVTLNIRLHANQQRIEDSNARFTVIKAGKRFGKTKLALFRLIKRALMFPGDMFWYLAPTYRMAKTIAWIEMKRMIPPGMVRRANETELVIELVNGSMICLIGCDNEDALRGTQLRAVVFDEAAYIKRDIWPSIISGQLLGFKGKSYADFISSPNKLGMNWFSDFHSEAERKMAQGDRDWAAFYFTIYDNPTLTKKEIDDLKANTPDDIWDLEYMAKESPYAGTLYGEFNAALHLGEYEGKEKLPVCRAIDWGISHPTACLWMKIDRAGKMVYIYDEYVKSGALIDEVAETIKFITGGVNLEFTVCDPSMKQRLGIRSSADWGRQSATRLMEFARYGIHCIPADNGERGVDVLKMYLKKGMLKISPKCKNLIFQLKNLQRGEDEGDDAADCARYGILRIHDTIQGMNVYENEAKKALVYTLESLAERRQLNVNDPDLFPKSLNESTNWAFEECLQD